MNICEATGTAAAAAAVAELATINRRLPGRQALSQDLLVCIVI